MFGTMRQGFKSVQPQKRHFPAGFKFKVALARFFLGGH